MLTIRGGARPGHNILPKNDWWRVTAKAWYSAIARFQLNLQGLFERILEMCIIVKIAAERSTNPLSPRKWLLTGHL